MLNLGGGDYGSDAVSVCWEDDGAPADFIFECITILMLQVGGLPCNNKSIPSEQCDELQLDEGRVIQL